MFTFYLDIHEAERVIGIGIKKAAVSLENESLLKACIYLYEYIVCLIAPDFFIFDVIRARGERVIIVCLQREEPLREITDE